MNAFFYIAGVVATVVGLACFAIISGVYIAVKFFGAVLTFGIPKDKEEDDTEL